MKKLAIGLLMASATALQGCTPIIKELRHPGGYAGHILDERMFDASGSKDLQLLRATIILAMIARTGATSAENRDDGEAFVRYTLASVDEINILGGHIKNKDPNCVLLRGSDLETPNQELLKSEPAAKIAARQPKASAIQAEGPAKKAIAAAGGAIPAAPVPISSDLGDQNRCFTYAVNFESDIKLLEGKLYKLAILSLPKNAAKRLLEDAANGDILGSIFSAVRFAWSSLDGLRTAAAVQRTGLEIEAWQKGCEDTELKTVEGAARCLDLPKNTVFSGQNVIGLLPDVPESTYYALMRNIYDSCRLAPLDIRYDMSTKEIDDAKTKRINDCNKIKFQPRSRWVQ